MEYSRIDTHELRAALDLLESLLAQVDAALDPLLVALTDEERRAVPRAPIRFREAARVLAAVAADAPDLARRADFDPTAVVEDLDNSEMLAPFAARLADLARRIDDSRLQWSAEALVPSLRLYRLSKACAREDGRLLALVTPFEEVFACRRTRRARADAPGG